MDAVKFRLEGKTAFFKNPEVNSYLYFTYGHIHKLALFGIFGAILGYGGYAQMKKNKDIYPEFYEKLHDIKIAIVPNNPKGIIDKKVQKFNNSVGYASQEKGGNLIVTEQWLENPSWDIYFLLDSEESVRLSKALLERSYVYIPYLGKNDHIADISSVEVISEIEDVRNIYKVDSFFKKIDYEIVVGDDEYDFEEENEEKELIYKYEEKLPVKLDEETNMYVLETLVYTNNEVSNISSKHTYKIEEKVIAFI